MFSRSLFTSIFIPMDLPKVTENSHGIGKFVAGFFIVSQLLGGGIVALPTAINRAGLWTGLFLNVLLTLMAASTSIMLGKCWVLLQRRWPSEYRDKHCYEPYPEMCERALGPTFRRIANFFVQVSLFAIAVVFLLLSSKNIHHFLNVFVGVDISFCLLILALGLFLFPATLLRSPEDFGWIAITASFTTSVATVLICIGMVLDWSSCEPPTRHEIPSNPTNYFLALGTFLFAYGGHSGFPTTQHDMKRPEEFTKSSIFAFSILGSLYLPVCVLGYFVYGNSLRESVINSIQHTSIQLLSNLLITGHAIFSVIIVLNPVNQAAEKLCNVPPKFGLQRVLIRGCIFVLAIFVAESVPKFGPLLDLCGGFTQSSMALIFPPICYLFLNAAERKSDIEKRKAEIIKEYNIKSENKFDLTFVEEGKEQCATISDVLQYTNWKVLLSCIFIMVFGFLGGSAATFSAIRELTYTHFVPPCYISAFTGPIKEDSTQLGTINCCGPFQNITIYGDPSKYCSAADLHFYD